MVSRETYTGHSAPCWPVYSPTGVMFHVEHDDTMPERSSRRYPPAPRPSRRRSPPGRRVYCVRAPPSCPRLAGNRPPAPPSADPSLGRSASASRLTWAASFSRRTYSSVARTDNARAVPLSAQRAASPPSPSRSSARAWPSLISPCINASLSWSGRHSRRNVFVTVTRFLPTRSATCSWVSLKSCRAR